jgi:hypothetical protein
MLDIIDEISKSLNTIDNHSLNNNEEEPGRQLLSKTYLSMIKTYLLMIKIYLSMIKTYLLMIKTYLLIIKTYLLMIKTYLAVLPDTINWLVVSFLSKSSYILS